VRAACSCVCVIICACVHVHVCICTTPRTPPPPHPTYRPDDVISSSSPPQDLEEFEVPEGAMRFELTAEQIAEALADPALEVRVMGMHGCVCT
jgi:hypothetical protein